MDTAEREQLIQEVIERVFKILPETLGNLMKAHAIYQELTSGFYKDNPELVEHSGIVREVVNKIEGEDPTRDYSEILKLALPKIKDQISLKQKVTMNTPSNSPNGLL